MEMEFFDLENLSEHEVLPGLRARFVHSGSMTFAYWSIEAGADLPAHSHPHEQVAHMFAGKFELTVDGVTRLLTPGTVTVIPPNAVHSGKALTDCKVMDSFYPIREDYVVKFE